MKVIGIAGSLRADSNTMFFVDTMLKELEKNDIKTELISLRDKKEMKPCIGCYECKEKGYCTIKGDDFDEILEKMKESEGIILGSPVYMSAVNPPLQSLLARAAFVAHWNGKFLKGKVGGPVAVAQRAGHNTTFSQLLLWYFFNGMIVPGSTYWNIGVAGTGGARNAKDDAIGIQTVTTFAQNMAYVMKKLF